MTHSVLGPNGQYPIYVQYGKNGRLQDYQTSEEPPYYDGIITYSYNPVKVKYVNHSDKWYTNHIDDILNNVTGIFILLLVAVVLIVWILH